MRTQLDAALAELSNQAPELLHYRQQAATRLKKAADLAVAAAELAKLQQAMELPELSYEAGPADNGAAGGSAGGTVHVPWGADPEAAPEAAPGAAAVAFEADEVDVAAHGIMDPNLGGEGGMLLGVEGWDGALR